MSFSATRKNAHLTVSFADWCGQGQAPDTRRHPWRPLAPTGLGQGCTPTPGAATPQSWGQAPPTPPAAWQAARRAEPSRWPSATSPSGRSPDPLASPSPAPLPTGFGLRLVDSWTGQSWDYTRRTNRQEIAATGLARPQRMAAHITLDDPQALADLVDQAERRCDSIVARDFEGSLPCELTPEQRVQCATRAAQKLAKRYGTPVAFAVHPPDKDGDHRNWHVHMLVPTRALDGTGAGMGEKLMQLHIPEGSAETKNVRKLWQHQINARLKVTGHQTRITMGRTRPKDRPSVHLGPRRTGEAPPTRTRARDPPRQARRARTCPSRIWTGPGADRPPTTTSSDSLPRSRKRRRRRRHRAANGRGRGHGRALRPRRPERTREPERAPRKRRRRPARSEPPRDPGRGLAGIPAAPPSPQERASAETRPTPPPEAPKAIREPTPRPKRKRRRRQRDVDPEPTLARETRALLEPMGEFAIRRAVGDKTGAKEVQRQLATAAPSIAENPSLREAAADGAEALVQSRKINVSRASTPADVDRASDAWRRHVRTDLGSMLAQMLEAMLAALDKKQKAKAESAARAQRAPRAKDGHQTTPSRARGPTPSRGRRQPGGAPRLPRPAPRGARRRRAPGPRPWAGDRSPVGTAHRGAAGHRRRRRESPPRCVPSQSLPSPEKTARRRVGERARKSDAGGPAPCTGSTRTACKARLTNGPEPSPTPSAGRSSSPPPTPSYMLRTSRRHPPPKHRTGPTRPCASCTPTSREDLPALARSLVASLAGDDVPLPEHVRTRTWWRSDRTRNAISRSLSRRLAPYALPGHPPDYAGLHELLERDGPLLAHALAREAWPHTDAGRTATPAGIRPTLPQRAPTPPTSRGSGLGC